jgi:pentatricopeptide repeat protein
VKTYEQAIGLCAGDSARWETAIDLYEEMMDKGIVPSQRVYSLVLQACETVSEKG